MPQHKPILSQAVEDYLKAIYKLQPDGPVSTSDIAAALGVSAASVTNMVKRLAQMKMVEYQSYKGVLLTEAGVKIALEVIRHHRLLETYLKEMLGYSWAEMHDEAERLEHHISEGFEEKIDELLGYPTHDPHGHPIPTPDLEIAETITTPLALASTGKRLVIHHVSDGDADLLQYLEEIGLLPKTDVQIIEKAPFDGPLTLRVGDRQHVIGHEVASNVFVELAISSESDR
jgi:DtxR family Mn-dependent transcriptional regulator